MGFFGLFGKKEDNFIRLLREQAKKTLEGLEHLEAYMEDQNEEHAKAVERAEKDADELRRILIDELNRTFITPIDREDIFALSRAVDDVLDYAYSTIDEMRLLQVDPNPFLRRMASLLREAANEIYLAMERLEHHPGVAAEHAMRAKALENRVERVYREAIADLFKAPASLEQIVYMLKVRELYRHLSNAADRGDETANVISNIVVKMA
ncbi:MAG: DUF47 family protein [Chloroflexi bacterium]|nr:DUF47 family protein [Chloroflexota bacterium]